MFIEIVVWLYLVLGSVCTAVIDDGEYTSLRSVGKSLLAHCGGESPARLQYRPAEPAANRRSTLGVYSQFRTGAVLEKSLTWGDDGHNILPCQKPFDLELLPTGKWGNVLSLTGDFCGQFIKNPYYPGFEDLMEGDPAEGIGDWPEIKDWGRTFPSRLGCLAGRVLNCLAAKIPRAVERRASSKEAAFIVEAAIRAHGGKDKLARWKCYRSKQCGSFYRDEESSAVEMDKWVERPDYERDVIALPDDENSFEQVNVFAADRGWVRKPGRWGETRDWTAKEVEGKRREAYLHKVLMLYPLLEGKGITLATLPSRTVGNRQAVLVLVSHEEFPDVTLVFDRATKLLLGFHGSPADDSRDGRPAGEMYFGAYKDIDGLKVPMKSRMLLGGEPHLELEVVEVEFLDHIDDSVFAPP